MKSLLNGFNGLTPELGLKRLYQIIISDYLLKGSTLTLTKLIYNTIFKQQSSCGISVFFDDRPTLRLRWAIN